MLNSRNVNIVFLFLLGILLVADWRGEVSAWHYGALLMMYIGLQVYGSIRLSAAFFLPVLSSSNKSGGSVSLTFDDGPIPGKTDKILDILKEHQVVAGFFCIGSRADEQKLLVERIHEEGHIVGNHSYWHGKTFDLQTPKGIARELEQTDSSISKWIGVKPRFFRPPYGVTNPMVASAVKKGRYVTIGWSVRSFDTVIKDRRKLLSRVTTSVKAGDIIVFHDYSEAMIDILPAVLDHIKKVGLKVVRVDKLLNEKAYV
jgi:peptidoglycan-N-acetylglucosamine deacetylase